MFTIFFFITLKVEVQILLGFFRNLNKDTHPQSYSVPHTSTHLLHHPYPTRAKKAIVAPNQKKKKKKKKKSSGCNATPIHPYITLPLFLFKNGKVVPLHS